MGLGIPVAHRVRNRVTRSTIPLLCLAVGAAIGFITCACTPSASVSDIIPGVPSDAACFSIVVLPDTQYYSQTYPHILLTQTQWIRENAARLNIVFVTHSGDMVNNADDEEQWQFADIAMRELDGIVPYGVLPGNHDQPSVLYNEVFGTPRFSGMDWYAGPLARRMTTTIS